VVKRKSDQIQQAGNLAGEGEVGIHSGNTMSDGREIVKQADLAGFAGQQPVGAR
jgi:hypothetical protein